MNMVWRGGITRFEGARDTGWEECGVRVGLTVSVRPCEQPQQSHSRAIRPNAPAERESRLDRSRWG